VSTCLTCSETKVTTEILAFASMCNGRMFYLHQRRTSAGVSPVNKLLGKAAKVAALRGLTHVKTVLDGFVDLPRHKDDAQWFGYGGGLGVTAKSNNDTMLVTTAYINARW